MGNIFVIIAFVAYALVILGIGIFSYKKSKSMNDYFIGGRQLGSWTTAISAQASDMSGWLLMGLPGAIFVSGLTESWIAIGLFIGTYLNWKILAARLRKMSYAAGDAITIPEYCQKRFFTQNPVIRVRGNYFRVLPYLHRFRIQQRCQAVQLHVRHGLHAFPYHRRAHHHFLHLPRRILRGLLD